MFVCVCVCVCVCVGAYVRARAYVYACPLPNDCRLCRVRALADLAFMNGD